MSEGHIYLILKISMFNSFFNFVSFLIFFFFLTYEISISNYGEWSFPLRKYSQIFFLIMIVRYLFKTKSSYLINFILNRKLRAYLILISIPLLSSLFLPIINSDGLRTSFLSFIIILGPALMLKGNVPQKKLLSLLVSYSNVVLVMVIIGFLRFAFDLSFIGVNLPKTELGRMSGWMHSANYFATFVGLAFIVEQYNISRSKKKSLFSYVKILIFILGILSSGSRGVIFSLTFVMIINEYNNYQISGIISSMKRFILLIFFVLIGFFISDDNLISQFNENISRGDTEIIDDPRIDIFMNSMIIWSKGDFVNKFFGSGLMSSMKIAGRSTHNSYLTFL